MCAARIRTIEIGAISILLMATRAHAIQTIGSIPYPFNSPSASGTAVTISTGDDIAIFDGGRFTNVANVGGAAPQGVFSSLGPARLDGGTTAFSATYGDSITGVLAKSGGAFTTIAQVGDVVPSMAAPIEGVGGVAVSESSVVFQATFAGGSQQGIFAGSGGALTTIARTGDATAGGVLKAIEDQPLTDGGAVAFSASLDDGSTRGVFLASGGTFTKISKTGDAAPVGVFDSVSLAGVSADGSVAIWGTYDGGKTGLFVGRGGPLTKIAAVGDVVPGFGSIAWFAGAAMNDGRVAFIASDNASVGPTVFTSTTGGQVQMKTVIKYEFGAPTLSFSVQLGPFGLGSDRLAVNLYLPMSGGHGTGSGDNHVGILTIGPVPEPTSLSLLGVALAAAGGGLRHKRRAGARRTAADSHTIPSFPSSKKVSA